MAVHGLASPPDIRSVTLAVGNGGGGGAGRPVKVKPKFVAWDASTRTLRVRGGLAATAKLARCEGVGLAWRAAGGGGDRGEL